MALKTLLNNRRAPIAGILAVGAIWSQSTTALLIDDFETYAEAAVTTPAPGNDVVVTPDSGTGMIGERTLTVDKTVGNTSGPAGGAYMTTGVDSRLSLANGPSTNSIQTVQWTFSSTDLTEGGASTGMSLILTQPNDNDLTIEISINGGPAFQQIFPDGSQEEEFFFPFSSFANPGAATVATSLLIRFNGSVAWDAEIDNVESLNPSPPPPPPTPPKPVPTIGTYGLVFTILGSIVLASRRLLRRDDSKKAPSSEI